MGNCWIAGYHEKELINHIYKQNNIDSQTNHTTINTECESLISHAPLAKVALLINEIPNFSNPNISHNKNSPF